MFSDSPRSSPAQPRRSRPQFRQDWEREVVPSHHSCSSQVLRAERSPSRAGAQQAVQKLTFGTIRAWIPLLQGLPKIKA